VSNEQDFPFEQDAARDAKKLQEERQRFAALHSVFILDARAKELLKYWQETARERTPVNATIQEYAAREAVRSHVQMIEEQIVLAQKGGF